MNQREKRYLPQRQPHQGRHHRRFEPAALSAFAGIFQPAVILHFILLDLRESCVDGLGMVVQICHIRKNIILITCLLGCVCDKTFFHKKESPGIEETDFFESLKGSKHKTAQNQIDGHRQFVIAIIVLLQSVLL